MSFKTLQENIARWLLGMASGDGGGKSNTGTGRRAYAGAKLLPSQVGYWGGESTANSDIRESRQSVASRVRQLVRDMPWLDQSIDASVAYKVGEGFNFMPAVVDGDNKMLDRENREIKDAFLYWCEHAEANGRDCFGDIQQLIVRQLLECGEAFIFYRYVKDRFCLQQFEPECIDDSFTGNNIDQGIRYDTDTNAVKGYMFKPLDDNLGTQVSTREVPAENVIHLYRCLRPWQRRGISPLVQVSLIASDLDQYLSNELSAQQMASRYLAFVKSGEDSTVERPPQEIIDNLTIRYLGNDEDVSFAPGGDRSLVGLNGFVVMFMRILSTILKVPYHVISGEYSSLNYNTLREIRNNTVHVLKPEWARLTRHFLQPVYDRWLDWANLSGELNLKGYWAKGGKRHWRKCFWMPPGIESVDILRDIKGVIEGAKVGIIDPQDWIMQNGEDPDEIIAGLARYIQKIKDAGIDDQVGLKIQSDTQLGQAPSDMGVE